MRKPERFSLSGSCPMPVEGGQKIAPFQPCGIEGFLTRIPTGQYEIK
jgi:hypothetical protein